MLGPSHALDIESTRNLVRTQAVVCYCMPVKPNTGGGVGLRGCIPVLHAVVVTRPSTTGPWEDGAFPILDAEESGRETVDRE